MSFGYSLYTALQPKQVKDNYEGTLWINTGTNCAESFAKWRLLLNSRLLHEESGECVGPEGGSENPVDGTRIVFSAECDTANSMIFYWDQGIIW